MFDANSAKLVEILDQFGFTNGSFTDELERILYLLPGYENYRLGFRWIKDDNFCSDAIEVTLSKCWGGLIMVQWRVDLFLFGLVLRQAQMFASELESLDQVENS
ncbi:hypothetical protein WKK05_37785 (plasmid) [Nostoc sp. UHCC 0302]|uniref:hypothetical protein n=1 Tax=Nostoc sp. UHCC 0302 TaxID=3134896 RepID=UPI00311CC181